MRYVVFLAMLAGCVNVPELGDRVAPDIFDAPYPRLIPIEPALGANPLPDQASAALEGQVAARVARLRKRAADLRGPVVAETDRQRLRQEVGG